MLTLIVPVRDWPAGRLDCCIRSFLALGSELLSEILVIDFGSRVPVETGAGWNGAVKIIRLEADKWSPGEAINAGVVLSSNPAIAKADADILISAASRAEFDRVAGQIIAHEFGLIVAQAFDLDPSIGPREAFEGLGRGLPLPGSLRPKWGQGGLVFFSRAAWDRVGGYDSRFTGWGNEDNDFPERVRHAGMRIGWADRNKLSINHIWHPPTCAMTGVASQRIKNQSIANADKSVFRSVSFRHSNLEAVAGPAVMKNISPLVTLAIASTGRPRRIKMILEAIASFRDQVNNDFEFVIVDNGSQDEDFLDLKRALERIRWCSRVRLERQIEGSIPKARNTISKLARGRFICIVDDDDIALPNRLADHLRVFEKNGLLHGSHGGWIDFDEETGLIERNQGKQRSLATLLKGTGKITAHPAGFYRTDVMRAVPYDESFALGSDLDLALRMAALGCEIGHTGSYVTLRRFHASNVTLTGQPSQVSNGLAARSRVAATFAWDKAENIAAVAKLTDSEIHCANMMSLETLLKFIPRYAGVWQLFVPVSALGAPPALPDAEAQGSDEADPAPADLPPSRLRTADTSLLEQLFAIAPGELCSKVPGLNRPTYFRSLPVNGLGRALKAKRELDQFLNVPSEIISARQAQLDRQVPFNWASLKVDKGLRILRSKRFASCSDVFVSRARLAASEALSAITGVVADYDRDGEAYFLVTLQVKGYDEIRSVKYQLESATGVAFEQLSGGGLVADLAYSARSH